MTQLPQWTHTMPHTYLPVPGIRGFRHWFLVSVRGGAVKVSNRECGTGLRRFPKAAVALQNKVQYGLQPEYLLST